MNVLGTHALSASAFFSGGIYVYLAVFTGLKDKTPFKVVAFVRSSQYFFECVVENMIFS